MTKEEEIYHLIQIERTLQNHKWGTQNHDPLYWLGILMEEVGEVAKALIEHNQSYSEVNEELIQVAAVAVAMIDSINRNQRKEQNIYE